MTNPLRRPGVWIVLVLIAGGAFAAWARARGPVVRVASASRRALEQHLVASGRVRVPQRLQIAPQLAGLVVAVGAAEGQHVKAGDLLVQLDDGVERTSVAQAEASVSQAAARVEQLRKVGAIVATEALRQADTSLERATTELERTQKLVDSGAIPAVELETARRSLAIARAQKTAAEATQIGSAPMGPDSRVALTALMQAQAQLAGAKVRLAQTRITAPQPGVVIARTVEPGDVVQPSRALLVVAADADVELVIQPDERNLAWLALGQPAKASADAFPQRTFDATINYIAPAVDAQRGSIEVRLAVPKPPAELRPDMTVSVDLTVATKASALVLPAEAVRGVATTSPWVAVVVDGRVARRDVQLGIRGDGSVEIAGGLDDTTPVIVPDGRALDVGARVRVERD